MLIIKDLAKFTNGAENVNNLLISYQQRVVNSSKRMNLVSRSNVENLVTSLTEESLIPLQWKACILRSPIIDIGTGAGFPGIPLKLVRPELELTLVDSNRRKCAFMKSTIGDMGIENVSVVNARAEDIVREDDNRGRFSTLISRGVRDTGQMLEWADYLLSDEGEVILWKGSGFDSEIEKIDLQGWVLPDILRLPSGLKLVRFMKKRK
ncbi:MAG: 16S rRNA (guanine(527)-N(7))-methyltransferase RsmG [Calditrichaeota bacterium]|jgi:16S rRNA (guanine527-N7)-methyltransferase|nr:16S rRNA (guanine(527)-N(7))-methyltransferase RsmG [Calditrichota bacterium]MBT7617645.1 16S rRNA (guanine(527)-N(7))-methyltransferase RsmG [Calditrichota bacterium]MBT7789991.1 16S rRNA (guanine(527)-N(7))-methyltransferase RsmG [Calditrichota bacterium]